MSARSLDEVYEIAADEWRHTLSLLESLQTRINPHKPWQTLYHEYASSDIRASDLIQLYASETERLRAFFMARGFRPQDLGTPMDVIETPRYLLSVRGTASFAAALLSDKRELSFFYITTRLPKAQQQAEAPLLQRFHKEHKFLSAHETYPGHHLLDSIRRRLKNPVRRQIESPLFYEGWASYAESLLTEYGYADDPMDRLIDLKRRLWRSARCQIDVGLATGRMSREAAMALLIDGGFSPPEADRQIGRFQLNPGYQVCYTLGRHEIMTLRRRHRGRIGDKRFHSLLLEGGELPFHLIENRLAGQTRHG
jgi:uncharacterized protein (DUF885 family)